MKNSARKNQRRRRQRRRQRRRIELLWLEQNLHARPLYANLYSVLVRTSVNIFCTQIFQHHPTPRRERRLREHVQLHTYVLRRIFPIQYFSRQSRADMATAAATITTTTTTRSKFRTILAAPDRGRERGDEDHDDGGGDDDTAEI